MVAVLSFLAHLDIDDHFWPNGFWSRCLRFDQSAISPMNNLGVDVCRGCGISCVSSNFLREFTVHQSYVNHRQRPLPKLSKLVFVPLTTSMFFKSIGNNDSVGRWNCSLDITWWYPRPRLGFSSLRRSFRLFGGVSSDVVRELLVPRNHQRKRI